MSESDETPDAGSRGGWGGHVRSHARGLSTVALASVIGIVASFAFQVASARYLAPVDFGLLSAFLVVVSTAAIGSSSLQNIVTVQTAAAFAAPESMPSKRRIPWEAITVGVGGGALVSIASPWLADTLSTSPTVILTAAVCVPLSFIFADALGLLQGSGDVSRAVWWSTLSLVLRIALLVVAVTLGAGLAGVVGSIVASMALAVAGVWWWARRIRRPAAGAFNMDGITILLLTITFAWVTTSDVFFLRASGADALAGTYAAVTVLVKAGFLVPSTLSLYLLPRFVRNRGNRHLSRLGVLVTLGLSFATSLAMTVFFALFGDWLIHLLYGEAFASAASLLVPTSLAYMPWMAAQGMLIKMTSTASRGGALLLVGAVVAQWIAFSAVVPDVAAMLAWFAGIGVVVLGVFLILDSLQARRAAAAVRTDP